MTQEKTRSHRHCVWRGPGWWAEAIFRDALRGTKFFFGTGSLLRLMLENS